MYNPGQTNIIRTTIIFPFSLLGSKKRILKPNCFTLKNNVMETTGTWYKVTRAQFVVYTDPETGKIISRNLVMLEGGSCRVFQYPQDSPKMMLLKAGDSLKIEGSPRTGKIVMTK